MAHPLHVDIAVGKASLDLLLPLPRFVTCAASWPGGVFGTLDRRGGGDRGNTWRGQTENVEVGRDGFSGENCGGTVFRFGR